MFKRAFDLVDEDKSGQLTKENRQHCIHPAIYCISIIFYLFGNIAFNTVSTAHNTASIRQYLIHPAIPHPSGNTSSIRQYLIHPTLLRNPATLHLSGNTVFIMQYTIHPTILHLSGNTTLIRQYCTNLAILTL